jgi:hypothetical protein
MTTGGPRVPPKEAERDEAVRERFPTAWELQAMYEDSLRRQREKYGAAPSTVEALMWGLRTKGIAHLHEPNCRRRLSELSTAQLHKVIARLIQLRPEYPAITDELIFQLGEMLS